MPEIEYPYMPTDRHLKYVSIDDPFMQGAARALEEFAGDLSYPIGAVLVKDGAVVNRAGNGFSRGKQVHICPRLVLECPTGVGYELCHLHDPPGHAEQMLLKRVREQGMDPQGADVYLYGHWWACEPCWTALIAAGVRDLYVVDDAHERFSRDKVYAQTLTPSIKTVALEGFEGELLEEVQREVEALGLKVVDGNADARCVRKEGGGVECFLAAESVYLIEESEKMARQLRNVLRQI